MTDANKKPSARPSTRPQSQTRTNELSTDSSVASRAAKHQYARVSNAEFISALFPQLAEGACPVVCGVAGDPANAAAYDWAASPFRGRPNKRMEPELNTYCSVSSFNPCPGTGTGLLAKYRRRKDYFSALHCLMLDDLGTGLGAKIEMSVSDLPLPPTAVVETSPDNFQVWLKLDEPLPDSNLAECLIDSMIRQGLGQEVDPGMGGVTRIGRLPNGINGKAKYGGWAVRLTQWHPERAYTFGQITDAFKLDLRQKRQSARKTPTRKSRGVAHWRDDPYIQILDAEKLITGIPTEYEGSFKVNIVCPWAHEHTDGDTTGTAYFSGGGFKCFHGHCEKRGRAALMEWIAGRGYDLTAIEAQRRAVIADTFPKIAAGVEA